MGSEGGRQDVATTWDQWVRAVWVTRVMSRGGVGDMCQFLMRFSPMTLGRRGEPTLLTLGGRRATMVAGVGGSAWRKVGVDGGGLWGSSN
jgi:hypothetical protein